MLINSGGGIARDGISKCAKVGEATMIRNVFSLLCVLLFCCASTFAFEWEDCGSVAGKFTTVSISSCKTEEEKCFLYRGEETHVSMKFIPNADVPSVEMRAFGTILDVPVPLPMEQPFPCKDPKTGLKCPLKKDQEVEYQLTFTMEKKVPSLSVDVIWEFLNDKNEKIVCIKFPAKIK